MPTAAWTEAVDERRNHLLAPSGIEPFLGGRGVIGGFWLSDTSRDFLHQEALDDVRYIGPPHIVVPRRDTGK